MKIKFTAFDKDLILQDIARQVNTILEDIEKQDISIGVPVQMQAIFSFSFSSLLFKKK